MGIVIFGTHYLKFIFHVKGNRIQIRIYRQEPAARLIIQREHRLDIVNNRCSNLPTFCRLIYTEAAKFYSRITFQTLFVRKLTFFAESIELSLILKISHLNFVICQTAISVNFTRIIDINTSIIYSKSIFLKRGSLIDNEIVQVFIATIKLLYGIGWIQANKIKLDAVYTCLKHGSTPPLAASRARFLAIPRSYAILQYS